MRRYDTRPLDTNVIINLRNRIRLLSILSVFGVLVYLNLNNTFQQRHLSHSHLVHILVQPILLFTSIQDDSGVCYAAWLICMAPIALDTFVLLVSFTAVSRCFTSLTASCGDRLYEQGSWFLLASYLLILDTLNLMFVGILKSKLEKKDQDEIQRRELAKARREIVVSNRYKSFALKSMVINIFLFFMDVVYFFNCLVLADETPVFMVGVLHLGLDVCGFFLNSKGKSSLFYGIMRFGYVLALFTYAIILILLLQLNSAWDVSKYLFFMMTFMYIVLDAIQIYFLGEAIASVDTQ